VVDPFGSLDASVRRFFFGGFGTSVSEGRTAQSGINGLTESEAEALGDVVGTTERVHKA